MVVISTAGPRGASSLDTAVHPPRRSACAMSQTRTLSAARSLIPAHRAASAARVACSSARYAASISSIERATFSAKDRGLMFAGACSVACSRSVMTGSDPNRGRLFHNCIVSASVGSNACVTPSGRFRRMAATVSSAVLAAWPAWNRTSAGIACISTCTRSAPEAISRAT